MKRRIISVLILLLCAFMVGCTSKYTIDEAFRKQYPNKDYDLLVTDQIEEKKVGLFKAPFDSGNNGIGVAVFEGNDEVGWRLIDSYSVYYASDVMIEFGRIHLDRKESYRILYGWIDSPDVTKIEVTDKHGQIIEAQIINTHWKRVWYAIADISEMKVKAYKHDGTVAKEVPSSGRE